MLAPQRPAPPSHRKFLFNKVTIDSTFDGANCSHAQRANPSTYLIWIGADHPKNPYRVWFYFSVEGLSKDAPVTFEVQNMNNHTKLLEDGLVPVYRIEGSQEWRRVSGGVKLESIAFNEGDLSWSFSHHVTKSEKHYFALYYPWSNLDQECFISKIKQTVSSIEDIYFHSATIIRSLQNRPVQMITISSKRDILDRKCSFEDQSLFQSQTQPNCFGGKKCFIISARVHPGQIPSSHVMTGIIEELTADTLIGRTLRDHFVFYLFPMLNPDGVARGHYRVDTEGVNLNRCYINPKRKEHPSIYAIKKVIMYCHKNNTYLGFLDLHAQASRKGNFIYGNASNVLQKQAGACLFPKILSLYSEDFQYEGSNFLERNMYCRDKSDHASKEGCGRVAAFMTTKNPNSWTLQCSYHGSHFINKLEQPLSACSVPSGPFDQDCIDANIVCRYKQTPQQEARSYFTVASYHKLGKNICESLLDLMEVHPHSRIQQGYFKSLKNLRLNLAYALLKMAPNRFEAPYKKILFSIEKNQSATTKKCLKALYVMSVLGGSIPNLPQYLKNQHETILYPRASRAKTAVTNRTIKPQSVSRNPQKDSSSFNLLHGKSTQQQGRKELERTQCSMTIEKQAKINIIEIDKQIYIRAVPGKSKQLIGNLQRHSRYESQMEMMNFSYYRRRVGYRQDSVKQAHQEPLRLQVLPKLAAQHRAFLCFPSQQQ